LRFVQGGSAEKRLEPGGDGFRLHAAQNSKGQTHESPGLRRLIASNIGSGAMYLTAYVS
jgi:hypothetical protein